MAGAVLHHTQTSSVLLNGPAVAHVTVIVIIVWNQASGINTFIGIRCLLKTFKVKGHNFLFIVIDLWGRSFKGKSLLLFHQPFVLGVGRKSDITHLAPEGGHEHMYLISLFVSVSHILIRLIYPETC
ncbi:hypothetical protein Dsin_009491 [Dipteronia sinensis]|uniref:Uncharacterized protein n=1 Tax=Dipteronia sinensis TaxID=43782 RepID=A0AAE0AQS2_9ROSI|nr:hypothetical protein Dsin_009491 [Dipteronia sinensis]